MNQGPREANEALQPPPVYVCVRRTIDWQDEEAVRAELYDEFRPKLDLWNATFNIPYHIFRHQLKQIAEHNLSRIKHATFSNADQAPSGAILVPVDDDDWFAPDLALRLREWLDPGVRGYYWTRYVLEARPGSFWRRLARRDPAEESRYICSTNNYACVNQDGWSRAVIGHGEASRVFEANRPAIRRLPIQLSIQNRNLSSQTVLGWRKPTLSRRSLLRRFDRYRCLYTRTRLPSCLQWAPPYVEMMAELMRDLKLRGNC